MENGETGVTSCPDVNKIVADVGFLSAHASTREGVTAGFNHKEKLYSDHFLILGLV